MTKEANCDFLRVRQTWLEENHPMNITAKEIWSAVRAIRGKAPVVHSITNYVFMCKQNPKKFSVLG